MTAARDRLPQNGTRQWLGPVLRAAHQIWIAETDTYLTPITVPQAAFWARWTAVRYLADEFVAQYQRECALLGELRSFLPTDVADGLLRQGDRIKQLQQELDRTGRRRRTAEAVSVAARVLLDSLRAWCAAIEDAAGEIDSSELPEETQRVLAGFALYTKIHT